MDAEARMAIDYFVAGYFSGIITCVAILFIMWLGRETHDGDGTA